mgnify:CR=1 FL=1
MNFQPLFDKVLIKRREIEEKTASGIILAAQAQESMRPYMGDVLKIGEKVTKVKAGDLVYFDAYAGRTLELGAIEYLIMREEEIFGVEGAPPEVAPSA